MNLFFLNGVFFLNNAPGVPGVVFNNVTWSLFYEMAFYIALPLAVLAALSLGISVVAAVVVAGLGFTYLPTLFGFYTEFFLYLFVGAFAGTMNREQFEALSAKFPDWIVVALYFLTTTMISTGYLNSGQSTFLFAGAGFLVITSAVANKGWLSRFLSFEPLVQLGGISYSFYLLHSVALVLIFRYRDIINIRALGPLFNWVWLGACAFAFALAISAVSFFVTEEFYFKKLGRPLPVGT
jgi:exopolysaccharide production protein ExoZ